VKTTIFAACIALALGMLIGRATVASTSVMKQSSIETISPFELMKTVGKLPVESYVAI
jgi:hypothetical protein